MSKVGRLNFIGLLLPEIFQEDFDNFLTIVEKDNEFKKLLSSKITSKNTKDGRFKSSNLRSLKIRYAIAYYLKHELQHFKKLYKLGNNQNNINNQENINDDTKEEIENTTD